MTNPLVPPAVDLRDFPYMPLDVVRLRDSRLATHASGEGFRCAVLLWCTAWHQIPAGSLPNDDRLLAQYAGFGRSVREWMKHRDDALHGWVLCSDGRLYHPVVAEKAIEAWDQRLRQRWKTECARIKKAADRAHVDPTYPTFEQWCEHLTRTGRTQWEPVEHGRRSGRRVPRDVPGTKPPRPRDVPRETRSKGREGKGREGVNSGSTNTTSADRSLGEAEALARALREVGYSECSAGDPHLAEAVRQGVKPEELKAVAGEKNTRGQKPIAYLVRTVIGRRNDLAEPGQPAGARPADPEVVEREQASRALDDEIRRHHNDLRLELITDEICRERVAEARARFDATWGQRRQEVHA